MDTLKEFLISFRPDQSGFFFMWILVALALLAIVIVAERWICINLRSNVDAPRFVDKLISLIRDGRPDDAVALCASGGKRALPRILGAGIIRSRTAPEMVRSAMEEESLHMIPLLEKRLNIIASCGNIATLIGLMGTIYGLILAFAAVARPDVSPVEKSSLLAVGISAAMNTTLLGLMIAVPSVLAYSILRSRVDGIVAEIDRYAVAMIKVLTPADMVLKSYKVSDRRIKEEVETEPNMVPFMNLMVVLIPLLLSSSEFLKLGMIEIKLPESSQGEGTGSAGQASEQAKLDLGIVVTSKGFNLVHYFKQDQKKDDGVEIPVLKNGSYDYSALNKKLAEIKQKALLEVLRTIKPDLPDDADLWLLYSTYLRHNFRVIEVFEDHESIKIVAEDKIKYETIVSVMDAARGISTPRGNVTLFPNVSIAGGIVQ